MSSDRHTGVFACHRREARAGSPPIRTPSPPASVASVLLRCRFFAGREDSRQCRDNCRRSWSWPWPWPCDPLWLRPSGCDVLSVVNPANYVENPAFRLCTTSGVLPSASRRERRTLPVARSMPMTLTSISSPSLQMSITLSTRFVSSSLTCTRPSVPGRISTKQPKSASRLTTPR